MLIKNRDTRSVNRCALELKFSLPIKKYERLGWFEKCDIWMSIKKCLTNVSTTPLWSLIIPPFFVVHQSATIKILVSDIETECFNFKFDGNLPIYSRRSTGVSIHLWFLNVDHLVRNFAQRKCQTNAVDRFRLNRTLC